MDLAHIPDCNSRSELTTALFQTHDYFNNFFPAKPGELASYFYITVVYFKYFEGTLRTEAFPVFQGRLDTSLAQPVCATKHVVD